MNFKDLSEKYGNNISKELFNLIGLGTIIYTRDPNYCDFDTELIELEKYFCPRFILGTVELAVSWRKEIEEVHYAKKISWDQARDEVIGKEALINCYDNLDPDLLYKDYLRQTKNDPLIVKTDSFSYEEYFEAIDNTPQNVKDEYLAQFINMAVSSEKPLEIMDVIILILASEKYNIHAVSKKTHNLAGLLNRKVLGQEIAVDRFVKSLFINDMKKQDERSGPAATFLFAGPPGVGKTLLAEEYGKLSGRPYRLFPMNLYNAHESNLSLTGFDRTYRDSHEGELIKFVQSNPNAVIVFDEFEKAHEKVQSIFYHILEGGWLQSTYSFAKVDFKNTICIFTTNAGRDYYSSHYGEELSLVPTQTIIDAIIKDTRPKPGSRVDLSINPINEAIMSRLAKGEIITFNHMTDTKAITPIVEAGLNKGKEIVRERYGFDNIKLDEGIPHLLMMSLGSKVDARIAMEKSTNLIPEMLYEISDKVEERWQSDDVEIDFTIGENLNANSCTADEIIGMKPADIMVVTNKNRAELFDKNLPGIYDRLHVMSITTGEEKWKETVEKYSLEAGIVNAFVDFTDALDEGCKSPIMLSLSGRLAECIIKNTGMNVVAFSFDRNFADDDRVDLKKIGIRKVLVLPENKNEIKETIRHHLYNEHLSAQVEKNRRCGKVVEWETSVSDDIKNNRITILLHDFRKANSLDLDAQDLIVQDDIKHPTTLEDIVGVDKAVREIERFREFLKNPREYAHMGQGVPQGILLYGKPGTGKTMLAKALANEADCPFISTTGTQFVNGTLDMESVFSIARKYSPSVLFIDEIDAFALDRMSGEGCKEIINTMLTEMDGFANHEGKPVLVVAATNFGERANGITEQVEDAIKLDKALMSRLKTKIYVDLPDVDDIKDYICKKKEEFSSNFQTINLEKLSNRDIEYVAGFMDGRNVSLRDVDTVIGLAKNKVYDAMRHSDRSVPQNVTREVLIDAFEEYTLGERREENSKTDKYNTAIHESGHTVLGYILMKEYFTQKYVTIVSRGSSAGYALKESGKTDWNKQELLNLICVELAGRAAEVVFNGDRGYTVGIRADLQKAIGIAKDMVNNYLMYEYSPFPEDNEKLVRSIINEQMERAIEQIKIHKDKVKEMADYLIEREHLDEDEIIEVMEGRGLNVLTAECIITEEAGENMIHGVDTDEVDKYIVSEIINGSIADIEAKGTIHAWVHGKGDQGGSCFAEIRLWTDSKDPVVIAVRSEDNYYVKSGSIGSNIMGVRWLINIARQKGWKTLDIASPYQGIWGWATGWKAKQEISRDYIKLIQEAKDDGLEMYFKCEKTYRAFRAELE